MKTTKTAKTFVRGISGIQGNDYSWNVTINVLQGGRVVEYDYFRPLSDREYTRFTQQITRAGYIVDLARVTNDAGVFVWVKRATTGEPINAGSNSKYDRMGW